MSKKIIRRMTLAVLMITMIIGMVSTVYAAKFKTKTVSDVTYYDSGCLKSLTVTVQMEEDKDNKTADSYGKIAIHNGDTKYSPEKKYSTDGSKWPEIKDDSTLIAMSSEKEVLWSDGKSHTIKVTFDDKAVKIDKKKTYNVVLWTRSADNGVYPEVVVGKIGALEASGNAATHDHKYSDEYTVDKEATCTEKGSKSRHCTVEGCDAKTDVKEIEAKGHTLVTDAAVAATCIKTGLTEGSHCSVCNAVIKAQETVPVIDHKYSDEYTVDKEPTCTEEGSESRHCTVEGCDAKIDVTVIPATGHKYSDEYTVDKEPTCTEEGSKSRHCTVEGCDAKTDVQKIEAKGHTEVTDEAVAATCIKTGLTEGSHCSVCGTVIKAQETVPLTDHTYSDEYTVDKEATCEEDGVQSRHCTVEGCTAVTDEETIQATGHDLVIDEAVAATSTTHGLTAGSHCSICGEVLEEQEIVHVPVTDAAVAATCTTAGKTAGSHCSVCGTVIKAQTTVAATGHTVVTDAAVAATCTTAGKTAGSHCSVCGTVIKAQTTVAATGHKFPDAWTVTKKATATTKGTKVKKCLNGCGKTIESVIPATGTSTTKKATTTTTKASTTSKTSTTSPKTGDTSFLWLWIVLALACVVGMAVTVPMLIKRHRN